MPNKSADDSLRRIEETQAALRDSIERARELAEESERLVLRHREQAKQPPETKPAP